MNKKVYAMNVKTWWNHGQPETKRGPIVKSGNAFFGWSIEADNELGRLNFGLHGEVPLDWIDYINKIKVWIKTT